MKLLQARLFPEMQYWRDFASGLLSRFQGTSKVGISKQLTIRKEKRVRMVRVRGRLENSVTQTGAKESQMLSNRPDSL